MSKNKIFILLFMFFTFIGFSFLYFVEYRNQNNQKSIEKIRKVQDEVDKIIKKEKKDNNNFGNKSGDFYNVVKNKDISKGDIDVNSGDNSVSNKDIDLNIGTGKFDDVSLEDLKSASNGIGINKNDFQYLKLLEKIWEKDKDKDILLKIINGYISLYDFENAMKYLDKLYKIDSELAGLSADKALYIFFNNMNFTKKNVENISSVIEKFHKKNMIGNDGLNFYKSLLEISKFNIDKFYKKVNSLNKNGKYKDFKSAAISAKNEYESYKDVPKYYLKGLLSYVLLQNEYFVLANRLAKDVIDKDKSYVLPYQVLSYSNFIIGNFDKSKKYMNKLLEIDYGNADIYNFFLGVIFFWQGEYRDAISFLSQVEKSVYKKDALRYLILSYYQIGDNTKIVENMQKLKNNYDLSYEDYFTFFDIIFYRPWKQGKKFDIYNSRRDMVVDYITSCYQNLDKQYIYVCRYGRGGFHYADGDKKLALKYLGYISEKIPRGYILASIGDIYKNLGMEEEAKRNYINAIRFSTDNKRKDDIKKSLIDLLLDKK